VRVKHGAAASNDVDHALSLQTFLDNTLELVTCCTHIHSAQYRR
jgi:hypothetical protein